MDFFLDAKLGDGDVEQCSVESMDFGKKKVRKSN